MSVLKPGSNKRLILNKGRGYNLNTRGGMEIAIAQFVEQHYQQHLLQG